jgi:hypothetical protein
MANALYPKIKEALAGALINLDTADIRAILIDLADYTYNAAHDFLDDVPSAARVAVSAALGATTIALGVFDSNDFSFTTVTGDACEALILYCHDGGSDGARRLIAFYDTGVTGLPVTPNGGDINVTVNASGWFAL